MIGIRIGHGYDVHRLTEGRPLILGGVHIPYERGLLGHSDADVLAHAVMAALLGAAPRGARGGGGPVSVAGVDASQVSVQSTTVEHRGCSGAGEGMACHAVALLRGE